MDIAAIKAKLDGGAWVTCCRHPDIDCSGCGPTSKQRQCVLDDDEPEACEMSDPKNRNPVTDKAACEFWKPLQYGARCSVIRLPPWFWCLFGHEWSWQVIQTDVRAIHISQCNRCATIRGGWLGDRDRTTS